jgi:hypothetical protein
MAESGYLDPLQRHLVEGKIWPLYRKQNYLLLCVRLT